MTEPQTITLYLKDGTSDKAYQACIEPRVDGFVVNFAYGRRGSSMKTGTKTPIPVPLTEAQKIYDALVREKTSKGYSPGQDGAKFVGTELEGRKSAHAPQLLNPVDDPEPFLQNDVFWAQEKFDGVRLLIEKSGDAVTGINRRGLTVALPETLAHAIKGCPGDFVVDGELVGDAFHAFDLLMPGPYAARLDALKATIGTHVPTARTSAEKRQLLQEVAARRGEGVVFKRHDAPYTPGRPASGGAQLKHKFTQAATCLVLGSNAGKRSVRLGLRDGDATQEVGSVTLPANHDVPEAGALVEVRYLYAFPGGALYQPVYLRPRDDVATEACSTNQLKFKPAPDAEA